MGYKTKLVLAGAFVLAMGAAATAFGQSGGGSGQLAANQGQDQGQSLVAPQGRRAAACGRSVRVLERRTRLIHGDAKVQARNGFALITTDRGTITSVDASSRTLTLTRADNETVTVTAGDTTRICVDGHQATFDQLKPGDTAGILQAGYRGKHVVRRIVAVSGQAGASGTAPRAQGTEGTQDFTALDPAA